MNRGENPVTDQTPRASFPQLWPVVEVFCGWGAYWNLEAPFNDNGDPR